MSASFSREESAGRELAQMGRMAATIPRRDGNTEGNRGKLQQENLFKASMEMDLDPKNAEDVFSLDRYLRPWYFFLSICALGGVGAMIGVGSYSQVHPTIYVHVSWTDNGNFGVYNIAARAPSQHYNIAFFFSAAYFILFLRAIISGLYTWFHPKSSNAEMYNPLGLGFAQFWIDKIKSIRLSELLIENLHPMRYFFDGLIYSMLVGGIFPLLGYLDALQLLFSIVFTFTGIASLGLPEFGIQGHLRGDYKDWNKYGISAWVFFVCCWTLIVTPWIPMFIMMPSYTYAAPFEFWGVLFPTVIWVFMYPAWLIPRFWKKGGHTTGVAFGELGHFAMSLIVISVTVGFGLSLFINTPWSLGTQIPERIVYGFPITLGR